MGLRLRLGARGRGFCPSGVGGSKPPPYGVTRPKASPLRGGGPPQAVVGCYPDSSSVVPVRRNLLAIAPLSLRCRQLPSQGSHGGGWWREQAPALRRDSQRCKAFRQTEGRLTPPRPFQFVFCTSTGKTVLVISPVSALSVYFAARDNTATSSLFLYICRDC